MLWFASSTFLLHRKFAIRYASHKTFQWKLLDEYITPWRKTHKNTEKKTRASLKPFYIKLITCINLLLYLHIKHSAHCVHRINFLLRNNKFSKTHKNTEIVLLINTAPIFFTVRLKYPWNLNMFLIFFTYCENFFYDITVQYRADNLCFLSFINRTV